MCFKSFALAAIALLLSASVNAAFIDNNTFTTDTGSGLDWLDLTETAGKSYDYVFSQLGVGGEYEGWRYADSTDVAGFLAGAGGSGTYTGWNASNNGVVSSLLTLWGDISLGSLTSNYMVANDYDASSKWVGYLYDAPGFPLSASQDYIRTQYYRAVYDSSNSAIGSALVRDTYVPPVMTAAELLPPLVLVEIPAVPVPAAVWLFASGLIGLMGLARRKV